MGTGSWAAPVRTYRLKAGLECDAASRSSSVQRPCSLERS